MRKIKASPSPAKIKDLVQATADKVVGIWQRRGDDLGRHLQVGLCLRVALERAGDANDNQAPSLYGQNLIGKVSELTKAEIGQGSRTLYTCYRVVGLKLPSPLWRAIAAAGIKWSEIRDLPRLVRKATDRKMILASIKARLPSRRPTVGAGLSYQTWMQQRRAFRAWVSSQISKDNPLKKTARYLAVDRHTGLVYGTKLRLKADAEKIAKGKAGACIATVRLPEADS